MQLLWYHFALVLLYVVFYALLVIAGTNPGGGRAVTNPGGALCYQRKRDEVKADLGVLWTRVTVLRRVSAREHGCGGPRSLASPDADALPTIYSSRKPEVLERSCTAPCTPTLLGLSESDKNII